jgi:glucokinase
MDRSGAVVGVDIGGTKILALALDPDTGDVIDRCRLPTPYDAVLLRAAVEQAVETVVPSTSRLGAVGLGIPGLVDRSGVLRYGPNLPGVVDLDLAGPLRTRLGVPVTAANDGSCAAVAEHRLGAARGADHAIVITQGTGIGAGIIADGRLLLGAHGFAGEPGHVSIDPIGPRCACGADGHWEAVASGTGLANLARQVVAEGRGGRLLARAGGDPAALRGEHVADGLAADDPDAAEVVRRFAHRVAQGLAGLVAILDPEVIVLGGGVGAIGDRFLDDVRRALPGAALAWAHRPAVPVVPARFGADAGAIGAALLAGDVLGGSR